MLNEKINILFVIVQMAMGGSERIVHTLVQNLDRKIFNPSVAWFHGEKVLKEFSDLQIPLYHVPKTKRIDFSTVKAFTDIINNNNIHIVNAHHFFSLVYTFYGCKISNNIKLIYTLHSIWEIDEIPWKWNVVGRIMLKRTDCAIGVSAAVSGRIKMQPGAADLKIATIQNGVDLKSFSVPFDKKKIKQGLGLSDNDRIIGIVANLKKVKNHLFLLKAFCEVAREIRNVKLLLVGYGSESDPENTEKELRKFASERDIDTKVMFLGYRSDIPDLLSIMDVYCLTSFKEGLPISLIEAMAAGIPTIGTDVEGIRDVIQHEKTGFLVGLSDINGLKQAILTLLTDENVSRRIAMAAHLEVRETYSIERCIKQYQDLFLSIL